AIFFDEILAAPTTEELVLGIYEKAVPALKAALERHLQDTNRLVDQPSVRVCRFGLVELQDMFDFGARTVASLVDAECRQRVRNDGQHHYRNFRQTVAILSRHDPPALGRGPPCDDG